MCTEFCTIESADDGALTVDELRGVASQDDAIDAHLRIWGFRHPPEAKVSTQTSSVITKPALINGLLQVTGINI